MVCDLCGLCGSCKTKNDDENNNWLAVLMIRMYINCFCYTIIIYYCHYYSSSTPHPLCKYITSEDFSKIYLTLESLLLLSSRDSLLSETNNTTPSRQCFRLEDFRPDYMGRKEGISF